jgi:hypothetical protein
MSIKEARNGFPSEERIKKIKVGWEARIDVLEGAIVACEKIHEKRGDATLKEIATVKELQGPYLSGIQP